jgi:hypothetical protein
VGELRGEEGQALGEVWIGGGGRYGLWLREIWVVDGRGMGMYRGRYGGEEVGVAGCEAVFFYIPTPCKNRYQKPFTKNPGFRGFRLICGDDIFPSVLGVHIQT